MADNDGKENRAGFLLRGELVQQIIKYKNNQCKKTIMFHISFHFFIIMDLIWFEMNVWIEVRFTWKGIKILLAHALKTREQTPNEMENKKYIWHAIFKN